MLIKFTYPAKSSLVLIDHWPVSADDIRLEWTLEEGRVTAISGTVPAVEIDQLPTIQTSITPGVKVDVNFGWTSRKDEVEEAIRTLWGLLGLFCHLEIDIKGVQTEWIPENDNDREALKVYNFSYTEQKADLFEPRRLGYDLVARAMGSAKAATHYEIPLGFLRRGTKAIYNDQYIEAFYNFFFFLETLFAPGYSNPKVVKEHLYSSKIVMNALMKSRVPFSKENYLNGAKREKLLGMTDEQLLQHLVNLRGNLHHHALGKPGVWHPDKADQFREEAILLHNIVHSIGIESALELLYVPERGDDLMRSAREAGAVITLRIEASGLMNGIKQKLQPYRIAVPGKRVDRTIIDAVHRRFREQFPGGSNDVQVLEYKIMSDDASQIYALWEREPSAVRQPT